jgi:hypothetical protein
MNFRRTGALFFAALFLVLIGGSSAFAQTGDVHITCPIEFDPPSQDTVIDIPIYCSNDVNIGGFSLGFSYNSEMVEIDSVNAWGSVIPTTIPLPGFPPILNVAPDPANNRILVGWYDSDFQHPITPHVDGYWFTLKMSVRTGIGAACINVDSTFIPPAGYFIMSPSSGGQITPTLTDCGSQDINIGGGCSSQPVPPVAVCTNVNVSADENCQATASIDDGSYDPEGQDITLTQVPPGPYPLGETTVQLIVTDSDQLADTCEALVTVVDDTPPVVQCPGNFVLNAGPDCSATVPDAGSATDNCSVASFVSVPPVGTVLDGVGDYTMMLIATDGAGLADTCEYTITLEDNTPPELTCPADVTVDNDPGICGAMVEFSGEATDNCGMEGITYDPPSGSTFDIGQTQVTVVATDLAGNADTCYFSVTVNDLEGPTAECPGDINVDNDPGQQGAVVNFVSTASDNCPGATVTCTPASGSFFPIGDTPVQCIALDASANADSCGFTVTVNFVNSAPVARDSSVVTNEDTPVDCQMQAYDLDGDPLTFAMLSGPNHGGASGFDMNTGVFTYTPDLSYLGPDTVVFQAFDGTDSSNVAAIAILVSGGGKTVIVPPMQYLYYAFAINPRSDTVYFGNLPQGYTVADVNIPTVTVNGFVVPAEATMIPSYHDFVGQVMLLSYPLSDFLRSYGAVYDTTAQPYTVEGYYNDGTPFVVTGEFSLVGKMSGNPSQFITPPGEIVIRGDVDRNARINMSDVTAIIAFIFGDGEAPSPPGVADVDCSLRVNLADAVYLVGYIFGQQDPPCPVPE